MVEDDKRGRQKVEVEHEAEWRFLCFGGTFTTSLEVEQNEREGTVSSASPALQQLRLPDSA